MEAGVYVDVLLIINYIVNLLLIVCAAKIAGRKPRGRRIVAAALFGSVCSLTIFLPFPGFSLSIITKFVISAGIVLIAFRWLSVKAFFKELLLFFAVTFCFAGVMLGLWMAFRPKGMVYHNGIVYFSISSFTLLVSTIAAYCILEIAYRITRGGRLKADIYSIKICMGSRTVGLRGLVDTGNSLYEPFSGAPVIVAPLESIASILPAGVADALCNRYFEMGKECGMPLRSIPYSNVGGSGLMPGFRPDLLMVERNGESRVVENSYIGISMKPIGDERYDAILNPNIIGIREKSPLGSVVRQKKL